VLTAAFETAGFVALTLARRHAAMAMVGPLASLAATLTVLYGWLVLRERPGRLAGVGAALACAGVVALALR
jgi:drug/metabolite transporter (DMT)-like permease